MPDALPDATRVIETVVEKYADDLVLLRRDLHAHPELSWQETRTTSLVADRLTAAGLAVTRLARSGLVADVGSGDGPIVALRADLDALPVADLTDDPWSSTVPGVAHACGHDVHTAGLVGAALALAELADRGLLGGRVRLLFQPAEEVMPGGAVAAVEHGVLSGVHRIFALHCDPTVDLGRVGIREGALTSAADALDVRLSGGGGHTSRPHLTEDLTFALAKVVTELPAVLSRRLDPRSGVSLVWGVVSAGTAHNVIPATGRVAGTVRLLDVSAWADAERLIRELTPAIVEPYGVTAEVVFERGVPPVVNDAESTRLLGAAVARVLGMEGVAPTAQSLGGEDFGWYLHHVPGAMGRLGIRTPGGPTYDLHQGDLRVDEGATAIAARVLAEAAVGALAAVVA